MSVMTVRAAGEEGKVNMHPVIRGMAVVSLICAALQAGLALAASPPRAGEVVPRQIPYRGYLDQNGLPVTNTSLPATFELFTDETQGKAAWTETQTLSVVDGQFTVSLGDVEAIPAYLFAQPSLFLQITVDGQQLAGRQRLLAVPYAQHAAASGFPPGSIIAFGGATAPPGWLLCDGSTVSRAQYPQLFAAIGATYGAGNGSSTFQLPDLRGRFLRGFDAGTGRDKSTRDAGQAEGWTTGLPRAGIGTSTVDVNHTHAYMDAYFAERPQTFSACTSPSPSNIGSGDTDYDNNRCEEQRTTGWSNQGLSHAHAVTGGDAETRPENVGANFIIRATP
jgi:microcystin-dependent protein